MRKAPLSALIALLATAAAALGEPAAIQLVEEAAELERLELQLRADDSGFIDARRCDYCESLRLRVDADTRAYQQGRLIPLRSAAKLGSDGATVFFDRETKRVTRIKLWTAGD